MALSPRERKILAGIEDELSTCDPGLATRFRQSSARRWLPPADLPIPAGRLYLLLVTLLTVLTVLAVHPMLITLHPLGVGGLTVALVVPWLLAAVRAAHRPAGPAAPDPARVGPADHGQSR